MNICLSNTSRTIYVKYICIKLLLRNILRIAIKQKMKTSVEMVDKLGIKISKRIYFVI